MKILSLKHYADWQDDKNAIIIKKKINCLPDMPQQQEVL